MTVSYAIAGASRGIGLEFVRQLASRKDSVVFAIVRNKQSSTFLADVAANLKNVHIIEGDVADHRSIARAAAEISSISGGKLDYLINNAAKTDPSALKGYKDYTDLDELDSDFTAAYNVNTLGVIHSIYAFLPLLRAGSTKKIIVIGSEAGKTATISALGLTNVTAYSMTKAAAEMATLNWALTLADEGFIVITMHPGSVDVSKTTSEEVRAATASAFEELLEHLRKAHGVADMKFITTEESVKAQLEVIDKLQPSDNGSFLTYTGEKK
ncbi:NAD-P-binding protein [Trametes meyenii]|nr:NAD-P-binding protein [Trametes meyenii]